MRKKEKEKGRIVRHKIEAEVKKMSTSTHFLNS